MKVLIAVLIGFGASAHADSYDSAREAAYSDALVIASIKGESSPCGIIGTQVANIMVRRLNGAAMSDQMNEPNLVFIRFVIRDAHQQPFYQSLDMKKQLVRDFRERYELECYNTLSSGG